MHPNGSRDQFNFANELMCVNRGLRRSGVIEEVKGECYDGGEREENSLMLFTSHSVVKCVSLNRYYYNFELPVPCSIENGYVVFMSTVE